MIDAHDGRCSPRGVVARAPCRGTIPPLNFSLSGYFLFLGKFFQKMQIWGLEIPYFEEIWDKDNILRTRDLF